MQHAVGSPASLKITPILKPKKVCPCGRENRLPGRRIGFICLKVQQREKRERDLTRTLQKKQERKLKKLKTIKGRKSLKKKAEALLHLYVRKRATDFAGNVQCYTCRRIVPFEKTNAGHFRHGKLDLDERNLRACCVGCNLYKSGELGKYALRLVEENGLEWVQKLERDADQDTGQYTFEELQEKITYYRDKLRAL